MIPIPAHLFDSDSDSSHLGYDSDSNTICMNDSDSDSYSIPSAALLITLILTSELYKFRFKWMLCMPRCYVKYYKIYAQKIRHGFLSVHAFGLPNPYFGLTNLRTTEPLEQKAVNVVVGLTNLRNEEPFISDLRTFGLESSHPF